MTDVNELIAALQHHLDGLKSWRAVLAYSSNQVKDMENKLKESADYALAKSSTEEAKRNIETFDSSVRETATLIYSEHRIKKPIATVEVQDSRELQIVADPQRVMEWLLENAPIAIDMTVNNDILKDLVERGKIPEDIARMNKTTRVRIATKL